MHPIGSKKDVWGFKELPPPNYVPLTGEYACTTSHRREPPPGSLTTQLSNAVNPNPAQSSSKDPVGSELSRTNKSASPLAAVVSQRTVSPGTIGKTNVAKSPTSARLKGLEAMPSTRSIGGGGRSVKHVIVRSSTACSKRKTSVRIEPDRVGA